MPGPLGKEATGSEPLIRILNALCTGTVYYTNNNHTDTDIYTQRKLEASVVTTNALQAAVNNCRRDTSSDAWQKTEQTVRVFSSQQVNCST